MTDETITIRRSTLRRSLSRSWQDGYDKGAGDTRQPAAMLLGLLIGFVSGCGFTWGVLSWPILS